MMRCLNTERSMVEGVRERKGEIKMQLLWSFWYCHGQPWFQLQFGTTECAVLINLSCSYPNYVPFSFPQFTRTSFSALFLSFLTQSSLFFIPYAYILQMSVIRVTQSV